MHLNLEKSSRFKEEVDEYNQVIKNIPDGDLKTEINDLVKKLIFEVRSIDTQHSELFAGKKLPTMVTDSRQKILELRRKISKKINSWKQAQDL